MDKGRPNIVKPQKRSSVWLKDKPSDSSFFIFFFRLSPSVAIRSFFGVRNCEYSSMHGGIHKASAAAPKRKPENLNLSSRVGGKKAHQICTHSSGKKTPSSIIPGQLSVVVCGWCVGGWLDAYFL